VYGHFYLGRQIAKNKLLENREIHNIIYNCGRPAMYNIQVCESKDFKRIERVSCRL